MAKDIVSVYTVEKPEVHPHAENFWSCNRECLKQEEADRLVFLAKNV